MQHFHEPQIEQLDGQTLGASWGGTSLRCRLENARISIAHLGCQRVRNGVKKLAVLPEQLGEHCDRGAAACCARVAERSEALE